MNPCEKGHKYWFTPSGEPTCDCRYWEECKRVAGIYYNNTMKESNKAEEKSCIRCGEPESDVRKYGSVCKTWDTFYGNHKYMDKPQEQGFECKAPNGEDIPCDCPIHLAIRDTNEDQREVVEKAEEQSLEERVDELDVIKCESGRCDHIRCLECTEKMDKLLAFIQQELENQKAEILEKVDRAKEVYKEDVLDDEDNEVLRRKGEVKEHVDSCCNETLDYVIKRIT